MCFIEVIDTAGQGVSFSLQPRQYYPYSAPQRNTQRCVTSGSGMVFIRALSFAAH